MTRKQVQAMIAKLRATAELFGMPTEAVETMRQVADELEALLECEELGDDEISGGGPPLKTSDEEAVRLWSEAVAKQHRKKGKRDDR